MRGKIGVYGIAPVAFLQDARITPNELRVFVSISSYQGTNEEAYPTLEQIAIRGFPGEANKSRINAASSAVRGLVKKGWLEQRRRHFQSPVYCVLFEVEAPLPTRSGDAEADRVPNDSGEGFPNESGEAIPNDSGDITKNPTVQPHSETTSTAADAAEPSEELFFEPPIRHNPESNEEPRKPKPPPKTQAHPEFKRLMALGHDLHVEVTGSKPVINGVDGKALNRLIASHGPPECERMIRLLAEANRKATSDFWRCGVGWATLVARWNALQAGNRKRADPGSGAATPEGAARTDRMIRRMRENSERASARVHAGMGGGPDG